MSVFSDIIEDIEQGNLDTAASKLVGLTGMPDTEAKKEVAQVKKNFTITAANNKKNTRARRKRNSNGRESLTSRSAAPT